MKIRWTYIFFFISTLLALGQSSYPRRMMTHHHHHARPRKLRKTSSKVGFHFMKHEKKCNLIGVASWDDLEKFPVFISYPKHYVDTSKCNPDLIEKLNHTKSNLLVFGGVWWCSDTREILGKLLYELQKANFPHDHFSFVGVSPQKETIAHLNTLFGITNVPTIIVMNDGKEKGRVVEYGNTGNWEQELAQLLD